MAPRKPQPWAKVRAAGIAANKAKNASATAHSAWATLTQKNHEHEGNLRALINRKEEEAMFEEGDGDEEVDADDEGEEKKKGKKKSSTNSNSNPNPKKITKPAQKRKATTRTTRSKRTIIVVNDEAAEPDIESWRPYGGESSTQEEDPSVTTYLGLARLSTWQYPAFKKAIEELLDQYMAGAAELETTEWRNHGGESSTDVRVKFGSEDQASMIKGQIEGEMVNGRKLQVRFVDGLEKAALREMEVR